MPTCASCGHENPAGARFCNACAALLEGEPARRREERKTVSVVFVDLVGFTAQAESLDPEDVSSVLTPYHARVREELERHGGTVEKFIGDAVMAVFGAPVAHGDDPERAVRAALAIRDWAGEQPSLQVRIGVNSGEALVSVDARAAEGEGMVAGDVVNTAARLQTAAPVGGVLVAEATWRATRDAIVYRDARPVQAKGKTEPVAVREAVEPVATRGVDVADRATTPLVGRERELALLRSTLERVRAERSTQLVTLVGVPGIGKSRLVLELFQHVERDSDLITWRQGRCLSYGENLTYWALGEIAKAEAGILESDDAAEAERKLHDAVAAVVSEPTEVLWLGAELRALVGLAGDGTDGGGTPSPAAAWRRFFEAMAERRPVVLVFEDLHWADDGLLDFLDELVDWLRDVPLLVVATARPELLERRTGWGGGKANATTISLRPLHDDAAARLISNLLDRPLQAAARQQQLLDRAGGNPLFAEQYVRMLAEQDTTGELPESVEGVIAARLDALPAAEKELLQEAAIHGKVFWLGAVAEATGAATAEVESLLLALERKDFIRRERRSAVAGDTQYAFQHVLLRDVAYGQIPRRLRAEKHRRAGEWIERLGRPDDRAELLAHHYRRALELERAAGEPDDLALVASAIDALHAAGERSLALSAFSSAEAFFADALELAGPDDPRRPRLLLGRAYALLPIGPSQPEIAVEAMEAFGALGDVEGAAEAAATAARLAWFAGDRVACDHYIGIALESVRDRPRSRARAMALSHQSGFLMLGGSFDESIALIAEALPLVRELGMETQHARLHIVRGTARCSGGDAEGLGDIEEGIRLAEAIGNVDMAAMGQLNLMSELHFLGRLDEARTTARRQLELATRHGLELHARTGRVEAAGWDYVDGRWDSALAALDAVISDVEAGSRDYSDAVVLSLRAWIRFAREDSTGAARDSALALEFARAADAQAQAQALPVSVSIALALGDRAEADAVATELLELGPVVVPALCVPFPTLADVAWAYRDLGRQRELVERVLEPSPIESPWNEAARAIADDELARATDIIEAIGDTAAAAYAAHRAGLNGRADEFHRSVGATRFLAPEEAAAEGR